MAPLTVNIFLKPECRAGLKIKVAWSSPGVCIIKQEIRHMCYDLFTPTRDTGSYQKYILQQLIASSWNWCIQWSFFGMYENLTHPNKALLV